MIASLTSNRLLIGSLRVVAAVFGATRAGQVGGGGHEDIGGVLLHLTDERLAVVDVVGRDAIDGGLAAQATGCVLEGAGRAIERAGDQAVLAVPGVNGMASELTYFLKSVIIKFIANDTNVSEITQARQIMLDTRQGHSMSDFVRNPELHIARLKETRIPEVLTVNGRAELVILDTETYESMVEQLNHQREKEIAAARVHMAQALKNAPPQEPITEAEMETRQAAMRELVAETERLGLYR